MCIKGSYEVERGLGGEYKKANMKRCDVRLVLKEGWPDHFLIMIQMLIPAGVVDCCGFPSSSITYSITQPHQKWTCS